MKNPDFVLEMQVRDYECDIQGIVNNANYLHYLEHTRHQFLNSKNISFAKLHYMGIDAVIARVNIQYKNSLGPEDEFLSYLKVEVQDYKQIFHQEIVRKKDGKVCIKAQIENVCLENGRLMKENPWAEQLKQQL